MIEICRRVRVRWTNIKRSIRWARRDEAFEKLVDHRSSRFVDQHYFMRIEGKIFFSLFPALFLLSAHSFSFSVICLPFCALLTSFYFCFLFLFSSLLPPLLSVPSSSLFLFTLSALSLLSLALSSLPNLCFSPSSFVYFTLSLSLSTSFLSCIPPPLAIDPKHCCGMLNSQRIKLFRRGRTGVHAINLGRFPFLSVAERQPRTPEKLQRIEGLPRYRRLPTLQNYPNRRGLVKSREKERPVNSIRRRSESWRRGGGRAARRGEYQSREAISTFSSVKSTETKPGGLFFQGTDRTRSVDGV